VQGTARDVVVHGMFEGEKFGYKTVLTVHDEILTEVEKCPERVKKLTRKYSVREYENILSQKPAWMGDCPLKVEGWKGQRFLKS
jgi:DNA polymerase